MKPLLLVISGLPCTGKTTLGRQIAAEFRLPLISRDDIKESLFDTLGWKDREWSKKLGSASYGLLYYFIESQICRGRSIAVESNFQPKFDNHKFLNLKQKHEFELVQFHCKASDEVLFQRFKNRSESGERHPGHVDHLNYEEFKTTLIKGGYDLLDVESKVFEVDTSNFERIDYKILFEEIKSAANWQAQEN